MELDNGKVEGHFPLPRQVCPLACLLEGLGLLGSSFVPTGSGGGDVTCQKAFRAHGRPTVNISWNYMELSEEGRIRQEFHPLFFWLWVTRTEPGSRCFLFIFWNPPSARILTRPGRKGES